MALDALEISCLVQRGVDNLGNELSLAQGGVIDGFAFLLRPSHLVFGPPPTLAKEGFLLLLEAQ